MADNERVLTQHEVDALLSAIDSGDVETAPESGSDPQAVPYDFKRPERIAAERLQAIEALHGLFASNFQEALALRLRTPVEVRVAGVNQMTFTEFVNSLPNPTVYTVLSSDALGGRIILEMNPVIAFPVIERLLGSGNVGDAQPERPLTPIEWKLMDSVIEKALALLSRTWAPVAAVSFEVKARESNPHLARTFGADETVVAVVIEVSTGNHKGYLNLCLPLSAIEVHAEKLNVHVPAPPGPSVAGHAEAISRELGPAELELSAHLQVEAIRVRDLEALEPGDLVRLHHAESAPVIVSVGGRPKFHAKVGSHGDRKAVKILSTVDPSREESLMRPGTSVEIRDEEARGGSVFRNPGAAEGVLGMELGVTVNLAEKTASLREILGLKVGDVIRFNARVEEPLVLRAGERPIAHGAVVKVGGRYGLQVASIGGPRETAHALGPKSS